MYTLVIFWVSIVALTIRLNMKERKLREILHVLVEIKVDKI